MIFYLLFSDLIIVDIFTFCKSDAKFDKSAKIDD